MRPAVTSRSVLGGRGVKSYYLLELEPPLTGALLLLHTEAAPRGFTTLCQALGRRLVEAAGTVLAAGARSRAAARGGRAGRTTSAP